MNQNDELKEKNNKRLSDILEPALKYFNEGVPYIYYPTYISAVYSDNVQGTESFARLLWGACFANDSVLDKSKKIQLMKAIVKGTDRKTSYYWGDLTDYSQLAVEMTPIAFFMFLNKDIFDSLGDNEKQNISRWLYQINNIKLHDNNWQCFTVLVNLFLKLCECKYSSNAMKKALKRIEKMYLEDGWYSDGKTNQIDYYVSFAIHYYLLIYHYYSKVEDNTKVYLDRATVFAESFEYWFADDGSALPFGRSLTYKFAQCAFWAALALNDVSVELKSKAKGILQRNLDWWFEKDIFDENGILVPGYAYSNQLMLENYNASGSSYWALKSFLFLLIPDNDDFWKLKTEKLLKLKKSRLITPAKMVVCIDKGIPYAFVNGQKAIYDFGHMECKYEKFVYTAKAGFCISSSNKSLELLAPDSTIAVSLNGEEYISRCNYEVIKTEEDCLVSKWRPAKKVLITTVISPNAPEHIRTHYIETYTDIVFIDGGFAVSKNNANITSKDYIHIENDDVVSEAESQLGGGEVLYIDAAPGSNILFKQCLIPAVKYKFGPGKYKVIDRFFVGENKQ